VEIYFVRHGQTDWNQARKWQGWIDIPINAEGRLQAEGRRHLLPKVDEVFYSPLSRAHETARILTGREDILFHDDLRELNLGDAEGVHMDEIPLRFGAECLNMWTDYSEAAMSFGFPKGESKAQLMRRVESFLEHLQTRSVKSVIVVTHGIWMRSLLWKINQEIPEKVINVAIYKTQLLEPGKWARLEEVN